MYELISRGGIAVNKSVQMPGFALNPQDINNIIAYVRTLSSRSRRKNDWHSGRRIGSWGPQRVCVRRRAT